jgi:hypothetical protein
VAAQWAHETYSRILPQNAEGEPNLRKGAKAQRSRKNKFVCEWLIFFRTCVFALRSAVLRFCGEILSSILPNGLNGGLVF